MEQTYWLVVYKVDAGAIILADDQVDAIRRLRKRKRRYLRRVEHQQIEILDVVAAPLPVAKRA